MIKAISFIQIQREAFFFLSPLRERVVYLYCVLIIAMSRIIMQELAHAHNSDKLFVHVLITGKCESFVGFWSGLMGSTMEILRHGKQFNP